MGIKGIDNGLSIDLSGFLQNPLENKLVSQMNPVKIPDGEHGIAEGSFQVFFSAKDFHKQLKTRGVSRKAQGV
jgi:hypothetical protein